MNASASATDLRAGLFLLLALVVAATRSHHFAALPDASWAVFFVAGFYFSGHARGLHAALTGGAARWAFPLLMALAVLVDFFVITAQGMDFWSHYCVSAAYWFLVPSYAALWIGGAWLRVQSHGAHLRDLGLLAASAAVATSACYLISNGSFYWLSPSVPARSLAGWMANLGDWYLPFLQTTLVYIGIGAALHVLAAQALRWLVPAQSDALRR
jgi:hypothetical protein